MQLLHDVPQIRSQSGAEHDPGIGALAARPFHRRLRQGFLDIAAAEPQRCVVLDASVAPETLADSAWEALSTRLTLPQIAPA